MFLSLGEKEHHEWSETPNGVIILKRGHLLPQMLPGSGDVGHVFVQDVLLGADAVILYVLRPVKLAHVEVKSLQNV